MSEGPAGKAQRWESSAGENRCGDLVLTIRETQFKLNGSLPILTVDTICTNIQVLTVLALWPPEETASSIAGTDQTQLQTVDAARMVGEIWVLGLAS